MCPTATLSALNSTWTSLGNKPGLRGDTSVTNPLSHCMVSGKIPTWIKVFVCSNTHGLQHHNAEVRKILSWWNWLLIPEMKQRSYCSTERAGIARSVEWLNYWPKRRGIVVGSRQGQKIFVFSKTSRPALGPIQSHDTMNNRSFSPWLTIRFDLVPKLKIHGAIPSTPV